MSETAPIDARLFRSTMGRFATGVTVVTVAHNDGHPHAMTANAFLSVSLDPPLMLVSLNNRSRMNAHLHFGRRYGINVLAASQEEYSRHFGGHPVEGLEVNWLPHLDTDPPLLDGCVAHIVARVVDIHPAGDHTLYIGHVEYLRYWERHPLLFFSGEYKQIEAPLFPGSSLFHPTTDVPSPSQRRNGASAPSLQAGALALGYSVNFQMWNLLAVGCRGYLHSILTVIDLPHSFSPFFNLTVCLRDLVLLYHLVD